MSCWKALASGACISFVVFACGGGGGSDLTAAETVDDSLDQLCERAHECKADFPADAGFMFDVVFEASVAECITSFDMISLRDEIQASVDAGRIDYSAEDGADCSNFVDGLSCADFWSNALEGVPAGPTCDTVFLGNVTVGGACVIDLDCIGATTICNETTLLCEEG